MHEALSAHGTDLPIDYEHQTLGGTYSSPNGQAPAAGWIKSLRSEPGIGLLAEIEWTEQARKMIAAKEYRYLSPVAIIRKNDRKLLLAAWICLLVSFVLGSAVDAFVEGFAEGKAAAQG